VVWEGRAGDCSPYPDHLAKRYPIFLNFIIR
jgi:hypothetical protein